MIESAIAGLIPGGAYAMLGICLVLAYRLVGVLNFALAAVGAIGAFVMLEAHEAGLPYLPAALAGAAAGAALAALLGVAMTRWFFEATTETRATVTIALLITLLALGWRVFGTSPRAVPELFAGAGFTLAGVVVPLASVAVLAAAIALAAALSAALVRTATGVRLRALAERPTTAELLGIPARRLAVAVWAGTGAIASLAVLLSAPNQAGDLLSLSLLVLPALAAALFGLFRSLALTVAGGVGIGVLEGAATAVSGVGPYRELLPFLVILGVLLVTQRGQVWDAAR